jgi:SAM-dependent methyltransferase
MHAVPGQTQPGIAAYDAIAADYDAQVAGDAWMRRVLHAHYLRVFKPGDRVLDVGCGTGIDAVFLARHGVQVVAIDFSAEMIAQLRAKAAAAHVGDRIEPRVLPIEDLAALQGQAFDGLVSAFAALNTLPDLSRFASDAAQLVRPGGRLVLHALNRFSLWEWLGSLARRDVPAAGQVGRVSSREFTIGGRAVRHTLYFPAEADRRFFSRHFALRRRYSLGALRPPHTVRRLPPRLVSALEWLDVRTGSWPLLQNCGRFWVLDLERLPT